MGVTPPPEALSMEQKDLDFFRQYMNDSLQDILKKGEETIEDVITSYSIHYTKLYEISVP